MSIIKSNMHCDLWDSFSQSKQQMILRGRLITSQWLHDEKRECSATCTRWLRQSWYSPLFTNEHFISIRIYWSRIYHRTFGEQLDSENKDLIRWRNTTSVDGSKALDSFILTWTRLTWILGSDVKSTTLCSILHIFGNSYFIHVIVSSPN